MVDKDAYQPYVCGNVLPYEKMVVIKSNSPTHAVVILMAPQYVDEDKSFMLPASSFELHGVLSLRKLRDACNHALSAIEGPKEDVQPSTATMMSHLHEAYANTPGVFEICCKIREKFHLRLKRPVG